MNVVSLKVSNTNNTDLDLPMVLNQNFNNPLLDNVQDYSVSITRVNIPTSRIELLKFTDRTKYKIGFYGYNPLNGNYALYSDTLPNELSHNVKYYTNEQI